MPLLVRINGFYSGKTELIKPYKTETMGKNSEEENIVFFYRLCIPWQ